MDTSAQQATSLNSGQEESIQDSERSALKTSFFERAREKITDYAAYTNLKIREYFGKLNEDQLDTLLNFEFEQELKDNPPLKRGFNAKVELDQIRKLPKEQKRAALDELKLNLATQREAWATYYGFISRQIQINPNRRGTLSMWLTKFHEHYDFSLEDIDRAQNIISAFNIHQDKMKDLRAQHPDDLGLVQSLTGASFKPNTKFEINMGAFGFEIFTDTFTARRIRDHILHKEYSDEEYSADGFAEPYSEINYVISKWDGETSNSKSRQAHKRHENQHLVNNRIFGHLLLAFFNKRHVYKQNFESEADLEIKQTLLQDWIDTEVELALLRAKDEVLAMKKSDPPYDYDYEERFSQSKSYDYLSGIKENLKIQNLYSNRTEQILVSDYNRTIKNAISSFDLLKKKKAFSTDETIALLIDQSLLRWPRMARRLLEAKQRRKS